MTLLDYLRSELVPLMKRRDKVALRAVRDAIGAIENAEVAFVTPTVTFRASNGYLAGTVPFGEADQTVRALTEPEMLAIARGIVDQRLADAARFRQSERVDEALTMKAEALALADRLDAYPS